MYAPNYVKLSRAFAVQLFSMAIEQNRKTELGGGAGAGAGSSRSATDHRKCVPGIPGGRLLGRPRPRACLGAVTKAAPRALDGRCPPLRLRPADPRGAGIRSPIGPHQFALAACQSSHFCSFSLCEWLVVDSEARSPNFKRVRH
jgi:hypothetical protein